MQDMIDLQVDYYSPPAFYLTGMLSGLINYDENFLKEYDDYIWRLIKWDNKLNKNSVEATIYVNWERNIINEFNKEYVPDKVKGLIRVQLFKIINKLYNMDENLRNNFLKKTFISSINDLKSKFGVKTDEWVYGQDGYKHIKVKHPLEDIVNDSIYKILSFQKYPRGGNGYTVGATGSNLSQSHGATFKVIIDTKDWDNSLASNSPGQSGDPSSLFYRNLYKDWAEDKYFNLLYSKEIIESNLHSREVFYP